MPRKGARLTAKRRKTPAAPSPWVQHVHDCMKKKNLTYRQASLDTDCRREYYRAQLKQKLADLK